jgi:hypothetical protein
MRIFTKSREQDPFLKKGDCAISKPREKLTHRKKGQSLPRR